MEDKKQYVVFDGKTLSDIFKDIYTNSTKTSKQIDKLITDLKPFMKSLTDAAVLVPLLKDYIDIKVKNDDHLIKLTDVVQKLLKTNGEGSKSDSILSENEIEQLYSEVESSKSGSELLDSITSDVENTITENV